MKKTFIILGSVVIMATLNSCGNSETTEENNAVATDTIEAVDNAEVEAADVNEEAEQSHFAVMDSDGDGKITKEEFVAHVTKEFAEKDANGDGKITKEECDHFDALNTDGDDFISDEEFEAGHGNMFAKMDADTDGFVTEEEMNAHVASMEEDGKE